MLIGLALHKHEIGRCALLRVDCRRRRLVARVFAVGICAIALAGGGCAIGSPMILQNASSKKFTPSKSRKPITPPSTIRRSTISETADSEKFTESKSATPIPLPEASLLNPQPEPSCEITGTKADERQKLDYERQCYRHAEMIVRIRLQLLQGSVDETINAVKSRERSGS